MLPGYAGGMTATAPLRSRVASATRTVATSSVTVWVAFIAVHLWLGLLNLYAPGLPLGEAAGQCRGQLGLAARREPPHRPRPTDLSDGAR